MLCIIKRVGVAPLSTLNHAGGCNHQHAMLNRQHAMTDHHILDILAESQDSALTVLTRRLA